MSQADTARFHAVGARFLQQQQQQPKQEASPEAEERKYKTLDLAEAKARRRQQQQQLLDPAYNTNSLERGARRRLPDVPPSRYERQDLLMLSL